MKAKLKLLIIMGTLLSPSIALSSQTVVAWGDSLTGKNSSSYPAQFAALSGITTLSRGVGGANFHSNSSPFFCRTRFVR